MGTRVRVEAGDRIVDVVVESRSEALKAFKFAIRGVFAVEPGAAALVLRWNVGAVRDHIVPQLLNADGSERGQKIDAIKQLRNATSLGLSDAKAVIESGRYEAASAEDREKVRAALAPFVHFC